MDPNTILAAVTALAQAVTAAYTYQTEHERGMSEAQRQQSVQQTLDILQLGVDLLKQLPKFKES